MAGAWYMPATVFLMFIICCLAVLILVYWKASDFLQNQEGGADIDEDDISEAEEVITQNSTVVIKPPEKDPETMTYSTLKSIASHSTNTSVILEDKAKVEVIEHCTIEITLRFSPEINGLSGYIENMKGLMYRKSKKNNCMRFHIALLPGKRRIKTGYRLIEDINARVSFSITDITTDDVASSKLRVRLYCRRTEFGLPITKERCLGESYVELSEYMRSLSNSEAVTIVQALLPKSQRFHSSDDDLLSDGT